jgi:hypothetical protein
MVEEEDTVFIITDVRMMSHWHSDVKVGTPKDVV